MKKFRLLIFIELIIILSICVVDVTFQNDTFFTIANGNKFLENGFQEYDELSWHDGLKFTNDRYLFDIIISKTYNVLGFDGIYVFVLLFASIINILLFSLIYRLTKNEWISLLSTIIALMMGSTLFTARAQIISIIIFILENYCLIQLSNSGKKRYILIIAFLAVMLANVHASIFLTFFVFFIPFLVESVFKKLKIKLCDNIVYGDSNFKLLLVTLVISILMGFVSPLGIAPFTSMLKVMTGYTKENISEMQPIRVMNYWFICFYVVFVLEALLFTKIKVRLSYICMIFGLFIMTLSAYRCIFYYAFVGAMYVAITESDLLKQYDFDISNKKPLKVFLAAMLFVLTAFEVRNYTKALLITDYIENDDYPIEVCNYIVNNLEYDEMKIINHLNIGSYLEFKGIKAFVDSRTGMYSPEFNEGVEIIYDDCNLYDGVIGYDKIAEKYGATHLLLSKGDMLYPFLKEDGGLKVVYQDDNWVLYEIVSYDSVVKKS